jgi:hypothetical protein
MRMKFQQATAGNAYGRPATRPGSSLSPRRAMLCRTTLLPITLLTLLLVPASGQAADPLLSGYAGPGSGEQVVLGGATVGGGSGGSGGSGTSSSSSTADAADQSLKATTGSAPGASSTTTSSSGSGTLTQKPQKQSSSSSKATSSGTTSTSPKAAATATLAGAPAVVAYPTREGEVGSLPITGGGVLLAVIGLAALVLMGLGLRRLGGETDDRKVPQVSAR